MKRLIGKLAGIMARHLPMARGRDRLALLAAALGAAPARIDTVRTAHGHVLHIDPEVFFYRHAFFTGVYEPGISRLIDVLVQPGQTCVDVGANIGWHAVAMAGLVGPSGRVHAFEPLAETFALLASNAERNGTSNVLSLHQRAVSASEGTDTIRVKQGEPRTHASLAQTGDEAGTEVRTVALDEHAGGALVGAVDLIKIDVEGAERLVLAGCAAILAAERPPALIVEAAAATAEPFGYRPNDLLNDLENRNGFRFFVINERSGKLEPLLRFEAGHIGANILCVPLARPELLARLKRSRLLP